MERLNRTTAPQAKQYTEKIIQFGEGNFLRAFIEWIIWKTNQKTGFNASISRDSTRESPSTAST